MLRQLIFNCEGRSEMLKVGDIVDYHSIIGGAVTSQGHVIEKIVPTPNNFGIAVAWITGKSGCVALKAITKSRCRCYVKGEAKLMQE
jgi:hypothetical protein